MYFRSSGKKTAPSEKKTHKKQQYIKPLLSNKRSPLRGDLLDFRSLPSVGHFGVKVRHWRPRSSLTLTLKMPITSYG